MKLANYDKIPGGGPWTDRQGQGRQGRQGTVYVGSTLTCHPDMLTAR
jgi:hypothetical protein